MCNKMILPCVALHLQRLERERERGGVEGGVRVCVCVCVCLCLCFKFSGKCAACKSCASAICRRRNVSGQLLVKSSSSPPHPSPCRYVSFCWSIYLCSLAEFSCRLSLSLRFSAPTYCLLSSPVKKPDMLHHLGTSLFSLVLYPPCLPPLSHTHTHTYVRNANKSRALVENGPDLIALQRQVASALCLCQSPSLSLSLSLPL